MDKRTNLILTVMGIVAVSLLFVRVIYLKTEQVHTATTVTIHSMASMVATPITKVTY